MSDIRVRVSDQNPLKVRVGQQNSVKIISSASADIPPYSAIAEYANFSGISTSVIGGIAQVTQLNVSGISTFQSGISFPYGAYNPPNGVAYFNNNGTLVSSASSNSPITYSSFIFTMDSSGIPVWSNTIDGGHF